MGSSRKDLLGMPDDVQDDFGYALYLARLGQQHSDAKMLRGEFHGLIELVDDTEGDTYRAIYTVKLSGVVYVLHTFQKKSKRGIGLPKHQIETIRARWKQAKAHHAMHYGDRRTGA
jgi:phage-related protein